MTLAPIACMPSYAFSYGAAFMAPAYRPGRAFPVAPVPPVGMRGDGNAVNRFVVIGDAGTGDQAQADIARQMENMQWISPFASVLVLGDNVYPNGEPSLFADRILKPYAPLMWEGVRFYPVLGNHDVKKGFGDQQLALWRMPPCYNFKLGTPGRQVEFWGIDTTVLVPGDKGIHTPEAKQRAAIELNWLKQSLAQSNAGFKVVFGHYPLYSVGGQSKPSRAQMQRTLEGILAPIFKQYGVDLYMAGHEHHYEKPRCVNGVYYLVSGAAGKLDDQKRAAIREGNGLLKRRHFMEFEMIPQGLRYETISENGERLDSGFIPRKNRVAAPGMQVFPVPQSLPVMPYAAAGIHTPGIA